MSAVEPEQNGMEKLYNSVQDSFRNFLNSTVGSEMGAIMYPGAYKPEAPDNIKAATDWQSVVYDKDGEDTGMRVQVWNGDGTINEVTHCSDMAMALKSLHDKKLAEGSDVSSSDIAEVIRQQLGVRVNDTPPTATNLVKLNVMLRRLGYESDSGEVLSSRIKDFMDLTSVPPAQYSGSALDYFQNETLPMLIDYLAVTIFEEHPELMGEPLDDRFRQRLGMLIRTYVTVRSDRELDVLIDKIIECVSSNRD